jgi:hypothetical protein
VLVGTNSPAAFLQPVCQVRVEDHGAVVAQRAEVVHADAHGLADPAAGAVRADQVPGADPRRPAVGPADVGGDAVGAALQAGERRAEPDLAAALEEVLQQHRFQVVLRALAGRHRADRQCLGVARVADAEHGEARAGERQ